MNTNMSTQVATATTVSEPHRTHESAASLLGRARSFRAGAQRVNPVLAETYRRRAAELRLRAWVRAIGSARIEIDDFTAGAG